jgi:hypothetical protein
MSSAYSDGTWTSPVQDGAKKVSFPWQDAGDYYANTTRRNYSALAANYDPVLETRTSYTNHILQSDDCSNAAWTKNATTATAASTDPEGTATASKVVEDGTTAAHNVRQTLTVPIGALSFGVMLKAAERTFARLRINNATDNDVATAVFNLSTGVVSAGTGTIKKLSKGWYWCYVSGTATAANSYIFIDLSANGTDWSYAGTAGSGVYAYHATALTSIPTVAWPAIAVTAATRTVSVPNVDADDPISFLVEEDEPGEGELMLGVAKWPRLYSRIPKQQIVPAGHLFATPNYPPDEWITGINFLSVRRFEVVGDYAVWMLKDMDAAAGATYGPLVGYYGAKVAITAYTADPATTITAAGHGCVANDVVLYRRANNLLKFVVSSVSGNDIVGTSTNLGALLSGFLPYVIGIIETNDNLRRRTRAETDLGQTMNLVAQKIRDFYMVNVSPGIAASTDIPRQGPYTTANYLAAWASAATWFNVTATELSIVNGPLLMTEYTQARLDGIT